jgi:hypothetical protein
VVIYRVAQKMYILFTRKIKIKECIWGLFQNQPPIGWFKKRIGIAPNHKFISNKQSLLSLNTNSHAFSLSSVGVIADETSTLLTPLPPAERYELWFVFFMQKDKARPRLSSIVSCIRWKCYEWQFYERMVQKIWGWAHWCAWRRCSRMTLNCHW